MEKCAVDHTTYCRYFEDVEINEEHGAEKQGGRTDGRSGRDKDKVKKAVKINKDKIIKNLSTFSNRK